MKRKFFIFLMLLSSFWAFSQPKNEQEQILQGKWVFESVSASDGNGLMLLNADSLSRFWLPVEIDIQQEEVTFVYKENMAKVQYAVAVGGNIICHGICAEWKVTGNQLQVIPDPCAYHGILNHQAHHHSSIIIIYKRVEK